MIGITTLPVSTIEISKDNGISASGPIAWGVVIICAVFAAMWLEKKFDIRFRVKRKLRRHK